MKQYGNGYDEPIEYVPENEDEADLLNPEPTIENTEEDE